MPRFRGWQVDDDGYYWVFGEIYVTARDMAKFGQMYLDEGVHGGKRILPAEWVEATFWYASGHGGNYIILLHDLDMVIVTTADRLHDT